MNQTKWLLIGTLISFMILAPSLSSVSAWTLKAIGDIGCKSSSIKNLVTLGKANMPLVGLGDYLYRCSPSNTYTTGGKTVTLQQLYDGIETKVGAPGNHEEDKGEGKVWARQNFNYDAVRQYSAYKLGHVGIITLSAYVPFDKSSAQYKFVVAKTKLFSENPDIDRIVYVTHEPMWTPSVDGGHGPNKDLRSHFGSIIRDAKGFLIQAHNHITWFGE